jgi:OOP family OmpA-OmpF porin
LLNDLNKEIMKKITYVRFASTLTTMSAQTETTQTKEVAVENNYNKWSVELAGGLNKPMRPMTAGYRTAVSAYVADLGCALYVHKFGLKADFAITVLKKVKIQ